MKLGIRDFPSNSGMGPLTGSAHGQAPFRPHAVTDALLAPTHLHRPGLKSLTDGLTSSRCSLNPSFPHS